MMVSTGKSANRVTTPTSTAASVAPTIGMRSNSATTMASASGDGTPSIHSMRKAAAPATVACNNAPMM